MKSVKTTSQPANNAQNGRQQETSRQQTAPPTDPRKKINASRHAKKPKEICRDFLWGKCTKGTMCIHLHKMDVKAIKETVKFCHNFQNNVSCTMCNFLHVSSEEQKLFEKEDIIPRLLIERYKSHNYDLTGVVGADIKPQIGPMYNFLSKPPPPPPPVPAPVPPPVYPVPAPVPPPVYPVPPPIGGPLIGPMLPRPPMPTPLHSMLSLPPPPPPPPLPKASQPPPPKTPTTTATVTTATTSTSTTTSTKKSAPTKSVSKSPVNTTGMHLLTQPPPAKFDPSKPPPPYKLQLNGALKRTAPENEAGRKIAKLEAAKSVESDCNNCVQRELRIELFKQEMKVLEAEQQNKKKLLKTKSLEHERAIAVLKANIDPKYYQWFEDYIEGVTTSTKTVLVQVLKNMAANGKLKNLKLSQSQFPLEDALLTTLTKRRPTNLDDSTRLLKVLGLLANNNERRPEIRNELINAEIRINASSSIVKTTGPVSSSLNGFVNDKDALVDVKPKKLPQFNKPPPPIPTPIPGPPPTQPPLPPPPCNGLPFQLPGVSSSSTSFYSNRTMATTTTSTPTPPQSSSKQAGMKMQTPPPRPPVPPGPVSIQNGQGFDFKYNVTMRYPPPPPYQ
uniref:Zinc finger protein n=1 Tax=Trilocha varians TaxID=941097 RepID=A0A0H5BL35_9NEOP|nr:zinc finger protein [Trilocha varians]